MPLWVTGIPFDATVDLDFTLGYPAAAGSEPVWSGANVPLYFTSANGKYLSLVLPYVPPGTTTRRIFLTVPGPTHPPFTLNAGVTPPWVDGAVFRSCITGGGITNPACVGPQLDAMNAALNANLPAYSAAAMWAKAAFNCEPGAGSLGGAGESERALDYPGGGRDRNGEHGCGNVVLPRWRTTAVSVVGAIDPNDKLGAAGTIAGDRRCPTRSVREHRASRRGT